MILVDVAVVKYYPKRSQIVSAESGLFFNTFIRKVMKKINPKNPV
jgi:hypothetical protein